VACADRHERLRYTCKLLVGVAAICSAAPNIGIFRCCYACSLPPFCAFLLLFLEVCHNLSLTRLAQTTGRPAHRPVAHPVIGIPQFFGIYACELLPRYACNRATLPRSGHALIHLKLLQRHSHSGLVIANLLTTVAVRAQWINVTWLETTEGQ
jgi:hypothetical protein